MTEPKDTKIEKIIRAKNREEETRINEGMLSKRESMECIKVFRKDEVVGIVTFKGKLVVATKGGVYIYPKRKKTTATTICGDLVVKGSLIVKNNKK